MTHLILPDIPRLTTALAEWLAATYVIITLTSFKKTSINFLKLLFCGVGQITLQLIAGWLPLYLWLLGMLCNIFWMMFTIKLVSQSNWNSTIYLTGKAFIFAEFIASLCWQVYCYLCYFAKWGYNNTDFQLVIVPIFLIIFLFINKISNNRKKQIIIVNLTSSDCLHTALLTAIIFISSNLGFALNHTNFSLGSDSTIYMMRTFIDLCGVLIFSIIENQKYELSLQHDLSQINNMFQSQYEQYQAYKESSEVVNRRFHDLKHQLDIIALESDNQKRQEYIDSLRNDIKQFKADVRTGNPIINVILTRKNAYCIQHDINFSVIANGALLNQIATMDLCSLLGNSLDNAIEAVQKIPDSEKRIIKLQISKRNNFIIYQVKNYSLVENQFEKNGLPRSTKKDKMNPHGYGLKSISYITKKYHGTLNLSQKDNWFNLTILFPTQKGNR